MNIPVNIALPTIWPGTFTKNEWNSINFIVGANGTGKSIFADNLKVMLRNCGYKVRLLSAERLSGFEKHSHTGFGYSQINEGFSFSSFDSYKNYGQEYGMSTSAYIVLKERLDIRIKIEALLSDLFNKKIRLAEEGGYLKPKMQNIDSGQEYGLKENECHGMKEIISLLTFLYDDTYNCLIFDEPELHLHPQFQSFFLNEIRKVAGDPELESGKKLIFIITHSPYFLDIRSVEDLQHILVCHNHQMPTFIKANDLDKQDEYVLKKFLPRFNTYHKQFFFSPNPVFVEGYTDQQIISLLFEKTGFNIAASGSSIIDVGGKDEIAVFYKLCQLLNINCRVIADYDAFFRGKLREVICQSETIKDSFIKKGFGSDIAKCVGEIERSLVEIGKVLKETESEDSRLKNLADHLRSLDFNKNEHLPSIKDAVLLSLHRFSDAINEAHPDIQHDVEGVLSKHRLYLQCLKSANIFVIPNGELEHFFKETEVDYLNINKKDKLFAAEYDAILECQSKEDIEKRYEDILPLLKESIPIVKVDMIKHARYAVIEWIQKVQNAVERGEVIDLESLKRSSRVDYSTYKQILECRDGDFQVENDRSFKCTIYLKTSIIETEKCIEFSDKTTPKDFKIS